MFSKVFCFSGNDYLVQEKVKSWKRDFMAKHHNDFNVVHLSYESENDVDSIIREIESMPFLAPVKLVFISNFLDTRKRDDGSEDGSGSEKYKRVEQVCANAPDTSIIVFVAPTPDKRRSLFKSIPGKNVKYFLVTKQLMITGWDEHRDIALVDFFLSRYSADIPHDVLMYLMRTIQSAVADDKMDLFLMQQEVEKLMSYTSGRIATKEDVDMVTTRTLGSKIFAVTDAIGKGDVQTAVLIMDQLITQGEEIYAFWGILMAHFRRLLSVRAMIDEGKDKADIRSSLGSMAWKADEIVAQTKQFSLSKLTEVYEMLLDIDIRMKTGGITTTTSDVSAFQFALERFIFLVSSKNT